MTVFSPFCAFFVCVLSFLLSPIFEMYVLRRLTVLSDRFPSVEESRPGSHEYLSDSDLRMKREAIHESKNPRAGDTVTKNLICEKGVVVLDWESSQAGGSHH